MRKNKVKQVPSKKETQKDCNWSCSINVFPTVAHTSSTVAIFEQKTTWIPLSAKCTVAFFFVFLFSILN